LALKISDKITVLFCPKCGWYHEAALMPSECPDCFSHLNILTGTEAEINERIREVKNEK